MDALPLDLPFPLNVLRVIGGGGGGGVGWGGL